MKGMQGTCDVCTQEHEIWVGSLPFAPMSVAFCRACLNHTAYPLWAMLAAIEMTDGNVADWFKELRSYADGAYIEWPDIEKRYQADRETQP